MDSSGADPASTGARLRPCEGQIQSQTVREPTDTFLSQLCQRQVNVWSLLPSKEESEGEEVDTPDALGTLDESAGQYRSWCWVVRVNRETKEAGHDWPDNGHGSNLVNQRRGRVLAVKQRLASHIAYWQQQREVEQRRGEAAPRLPDSLERRRKLDYTKASVERLNGKLARLNGSKGSVGCHVS